MSARAIIHVAVEYINLKKLFVNNNSLLKSTNIITIILHDIVLIRFIVTHYQLIINKGIIIMEVSLKSW